MTHVGHGLTGVAIGILCLPRKASPARIFTHLLVFLNVANIPDWQFPGWGHERYLVSHSVWVNLGLIGLAVLLTGGVPRVRKFLGGWPVILGGAVAWLSHLLLDMFYGHGRGLAMFWPFSDARWALPLPWFSTLHAPGSGGSCAHLFRVYGIEFLCYLPLVIAAIIIRWRLQSCRRAPHVTDTRD